jgi:uncharacterized protein (TIGR02217 family)
MPTNDVATLAITPAGLVIGPGGVTIPGIAWPIAKTPTMQTRIQRAVSGRELRAVDYPSPLWQFQLSLAVLRDNSDTRAGAGFGAGYSELRPLLALYTACYGAYGTFLFSDPSDNTVTGQNLGSGNANQTTFQLQRTLAANPSFTEPIVAVNTISAVYLNGIIQNPSSYGCAVGLNSTGVLTFFSPPPPGVVISADFTYYFRCRFVDDSQQFSYINYQVWELKKFNFISVLP